MLWQWMGDQDSFGSWVERAVHRLDARQFSTPQGDIKNAIYAVQDLAGRRVVKAYVIINQPDNWVGSGFTLYVAMTESPGEALAAATAEFGLTGRSEVNGVPISDQGTRALAFLPGEVRLVYPQDVEV